MRVFALFTVISVSEFLTLCCLVTWVSEESFGFWYDASRVLQWLAVLGVVIWALRRKAVYSVKSLHRALIAGVLGALALVWLARLFSGTHWPTYFVFMRMVMHGTAVPPLAAFATLAYVLLGLSPVFRERRAHGV